MQIDGSCNGAGPIRKIVDLRLQIYGHAQVVGFVITTNAGKSVIIIGFNWLHKHNPTVYWKTGKVSFNQCPAACYISPDFGNDPEEETGDGEDEIFEEGRQSLDDGDRRRGRGTATRYWDLQHPFSKTRGRGDKVCTAQTFRRNHPRLLSSCVFENLI